MLPSPHSLLADLGPSFSDGLPDWLSGWQTGAVLLCITAAVAWLTARWLNRRRSGCAGDCSRCVAHGAETTPGTCARTQDGPGIRSASLRVLPGTANLPHTGDV